MPLIPHHRRVPMALLLAAAWAASATADTLTSGWIDLGSGTQTPYYIRQASTSGPLVMITGGAVRRSIGCEPSIDRKRLPNSCTVEGM